MFGKKNKDDASRAQDAEELNEDVEAGNQGDPTAETDEVSEPDESEFSLEDWQQKIGELEDKVQRSRAELQNFRKQSEKRLQDSRKFIKKDLFMQVLPIVDNFDAAMTALDKGQDADNVLIGVKMIHGMFGRLLDDNQIAKMQSVGERFDADIHEAVGREETEDSEPNTVLSEIQSGYRLGELVLRPARVMVAAAPVEEEVEDACEEVPSSEAAAETSEPSPEQDSEEDA